MTHYRVVDIKRGVCHGRRNNKKCNDPFVCIIEKEALKDYTSPAYIREKKKKMGGGGVSHQRDRYSLVCTGHLLHDKLSRPRLSHRRDCSSSAGRSSSKPHSLVNCHSVRWLCSIYCVLCICFYI